MRRPLFFHSINWAQASVHKTTKLSLLFWVILQDESHRRPLHLSLKIKLAELPNDHQQEQSELKDVFQDYLTSPLTSPLTAISFSES